MKTTFTDVEYSKNVVEIEANAIKNLIHHIDDNFQNAVDLVINCRGRIVVTGIGKAGIIGQKISATLASTGTPSYWLHSSEAKHGDLGRVVAEDVVLALSNSGETEITQLTPLLKKTGSKIIVITGNNKSKLAGFFTDGDLRRNIHKGTSFLNNAIKDVTTKNQKSITTGCLASEA